MKIGEFIMYIVAVVDQLLFPAFVSLGRGNSPDAAAIVIELVVFRIRRKLEQTKPTRKNITIFWCSYATYREKSYLPNNCTRAVCYPLENVTNLHLYVLYFYFIAGKYP